MQDITCSIKENFFDPSVRLTNLPQRFEREDYYRSIDKVVDYLEGFPEVVAIYQIGEISEPGISDIDLIVVFEDDTGNFKQNYRKIWDSKDAYLFMHGLFGMPFGVFRSLKFLVPTFNCKKIYGRDIPGVHDVTPDEKLALEKIYALEYMIFYLFKLVTQLTKKELLVRSLLCSLKALTYDLKTLPGYEQFEKYKRDIYSLRKNWWGKTDRLQEFNRICAEAFDIILKSLVLLSDEGDVKTSKLKDCAEIYLAPNNYIIPNSSDVTVHLKHGRIYKVLIETAHRFKQRSEWSERQLKDLTAAFYATHLSVPSNIFQILNGDSNYPIVSVYRQRDVILKQYYDFMRRIHPSFGIFDILRNRLCDNPKWSFISSLNKHQYSRNSWFFRKRRHYV